MFWSYDKFVWFAFLFNLIFENDVIVNKNKNRNFTRFSFLFLIQYSFFSYIFNVFIVFSHDRSNNIVNIVFSNIIKTCINVEISITIIVIQTKFISFFYISLAKRIETLKSIMKIKWNAFVIRFEIKFTITFLFIKHFIVFIVIFLCEMMIVV